MGYVIAALAFVLAMVGGYFYVDSTSHHAGYVERDMQCAVEKAAKDREIEEARRQATAEREKGRIVADRIAQESAETQRRLNANLERMSRELVARASASRRCFSGSVASLLDAASTVRGPTPVGDPPGAAAPEPANPAPAAAPDREGSVSELAAARAIGQARTAFMACRDQLRGVITATGNEVIE